jgi:hypothetical protein
MVNRLPVFARATTLAVRSSGWLQRQSVRVTYIPPGAAVMCCSTPVIIPDQRDTAALLAWRLHTQEVSRSSVDPQTRYPHRDTLSLPYSRQTNRTSWSRG